MIQPQVDREGALGLGLTGSAVVTVAGALGASLGCSAASRAALASAAARSAASRRILKVPALIVDYQIV